MFDKLLATTFLSLSMGLSSSHPTRADVALERSIMNSTEYNFDFVHEMTLHAHSEDEINTESSSFWQNTFIWYTGDTKPTDVYYWIAEVDNEQEVLVTFNEIPVAHTYEFVLPDLSSDTIRGIQFFQRKSLVDEVFYIKEPEKTNTNLYNSNILPSNSTANLHLSHGGYASINQISLEREAQNKGISAFVQIKINNLTYIANNSITGITPIDYSQCTNVMMYKSNFTNIITFTSGYYPRSYNTQGYSDQFAYLTDEYTPYISFTSAGNTNISLEPLTTGVHLVTISFEALNSLFGYLVFPGLTLGMLLLVPTFVCIMFAIIRIIKKGA